jgi:hypothetical protein
MRNAYRDLVTKPGWTRPLGNLRRKWEVNFQKNIREIGYKDVDLVYLNYNMDQ